MKEIYRDLGIATGDHVGATSSTILRARHIDFSDVKSIGRRIRNETDGSSGIIRSSTNMDSLGYSTVTATLAGGTNNNWEDGDDFRLCVSATYNKKLSSTEVGRMSGIAYPRDELVDGEIPGLDDIDQQTQTVNRKRY